MKQWIQFNRQATKAEQSIPSEDSSLHENSLCVQIEIPGAWVEAVDTAEGRFDALTTETCGFLYDYGKPRIPILGRQVALPPGTNLRQCTCSCERRELAGRYRPLPAPPAAPLIKDGARNLGGKDIYYLAPEAYKPMRDTVVRFPAEEPEEVQPEVVSYFGLPTAVIRVPLFFFYPEQNDGSGRVEAITSVDLTLEWEDSGSGERTVWGRRSKSIREMADRNVLGAQQVWPEPRTTSTAASAQATQIVIDGDNEREREGVEYLAVCASEAHAEAVGDLLEKRAENFSVGYVLTETIWEQWPDVAKDDAIRKFLIGQQSFDPPVERVLLVGSPFSLPMHEYPACQNNSFYDRVRSDHYYGDLSGDDYPDLIVARIPVDEPDDIKTFTQQILQQPQYTSEEWSKDVVMHAAENDGNLFFEVTKDAVTDIISAPYNTPRKEYDVDAPAAQIKESINNGSAILNYAGHGSWDVWASEAGMAVSALSSFDSLKQRPPVIYTMSCRTAGVWQDGPVLARELIRSGMCTGYVGATDACWGWVGPIVQDWDYVFFQIHREGVNIPAEAFTLAKARILRDSDANSVNVENARMFVFFGDPGMLFLPFEEESWDLGGDTVQTEQQGSGQSSPGTSPPKSEQRGQHVQYARCETLRKGRKAVRSASYAGSTRGVESGSIYYEPGEQVRYAVTVDKTEYVLFHATEGGFRLRDTGAPMVPQEGSVIELPADAEDPEVVVDEIELDASQEGRMLPTPVPTLRLEGEQPVFRETSELYNKAEWPPREGMIETEGVREIQGRKVLIVRKALAQCFPHQGTYALLKHCRFTVNYRRGNERGHYRAFETGSNAFFSQRSVSLTEDETKGKTTRETRKENDRHTEPGLFLIIAAERLKNTLEDFIEEKDDAYDGGCVFKAVEDVTSETGEERAEALRSYLKSACDNWEEPPAHVLLVGGYEDIPYFLQKYRQRSKESVSKEPIPSDNPYCDLTGDLYPDLPVTRVPSSDPEQVSSYLNAVRNYTSEADDAHDILLINSGDARDVESIDSIEEKMARAGFSSERLGGRDGAGQVKNALQNGKRFVNYSGHGGGPEWCTTGYSSEDVDNTANEANPPGVISISCYNNCDDDLINLGGVCLGPRMVESGKAAWFICGVRPTWYGSGEAMNQYYINAILDGDTAGEAYIRAKIDLLTNYGDSCAEDDVCNYTFWGVGDLYVQAGKAETAEPESTVSVPFPVGSLVVCKEGALKGEVGKVQQNRAEQRRSEVTFSAGEGEETSPVWCPWETLRAYAADNRPMVYDLYTKAQFLRSLANSGVLTGGRLNPLPHQKLAAYRFLRQQKPRRILLGDETGLGKTVEAAILIFHRLLQDPDARMLILTPASIGGQWQELLERGFGCNFMWLGEDIGRDAIIRYRRIIASMDTVKSENYLELFSEFEWDILTVDECHRLGYDEESKSQRYAAVEYLCENQCCDDMIFLSATPHTGNQERFEHILDLLDPKADTERGDSRALQVPELVFRQSKRDVTDETGNPVFSAVNTQVRKYSLNDKEKQVLNTLNTYIEKRGQASGATGFLYCTYHKLADSSFTSLAHALERRKEVISEAACSETATDTDSPRQSVDDTDQTFMGDAVDAEDAGETVAEGPAYSGEVTDLDNLLTEIGDVKAGGDSDNSKIECFLNIIGELVPRQYNDAASLPKILVFTGYLATQELLATVLEQKYGEGTVTLLNGKMGVDQRRESELQFRDEVPFMISTGAGGEGINLQFARVVVNFDLPWNPMRIDQRIGRIHRFGSPGEVLVCNLWSEDTLVSRIRNKLEEKVQDIAGQLENTAAVEDVTADELSRQLLGMMDQQGNLAEIYEQGLQNPDYLTHNENVIEERLQAARRAWEEIWNLWEQVQGFNLDEYHRISHSADATDVQAFVRRFLEYADLSSEIEQKEDGTMTFPVPEILQSFLGEESETQCENVVFDGESAREKPDRRVFAPGDPVFDAMIAYCAQLQLGEGPAYVAVDTGQVSFDKDFRGALFNFALCNDDESGEVKQLLPVAVDEECEVVATQQASELLRAYAEPDPEPTLFDFYRNGTFDMTKAEQAARESLTETSEQGLHLLSCAVFVVTDDKPEKR